ncbi:efflux RND transporter periplasmic adaptor subunit [Parahaliea aestuarii]|uniref:HlyD family efflux transporter periplasmic adaptor subunit n=1 Tax=Parahaliea aestuarii TaxID=1852021 RepID=A0A5C8ZPX6_9GAMM|nr:HlyD family efflux transporter periplasmic adaptor subunit [Parahaliea aestuarii]TXS90385.1 HlyD family efflux transporter periplasmic adaptor subunit [Parahaliea aestuarii]
MKSQHTLPCIILCLSLLCPLLVQAQHSHGEGGHSHADNRQTAPDSHADDSPSRGHDQDDHDVEAHSDGDSVSLTPDIVRESGIAIRIAGPGSIERHISVYGRLVTPPDQVAQTRARFPGLIRDIRVNVGDAVERNQLLAVIESNESLNSYELRAPIAAVVQARNGSIGELTGDAPLFTLVDSSKLWAELKIFPSQRFEVAPGQDVHVNHTGHIHDSTIASVTPATEGQPYVLARVKLTNSLGDMAPGDMVSAQIDAEKVSVALVVESAALQTLEDRQVVFVQDGDVFTAREVDAGRSDGRFTEITAGLAQGENYVVENSYLLKAELLKSGAEHAH